MSTFFLVCVCSAFAGASVCAFYESRFALGIRFQIGGEKRRAREAIMGRGPCKRFSLPNTLGLRSLRWARDSFAPTAYDVEVHHGA